MILQYDNNFESVTEFIKYGFVRVLFGKLMCLTGEGVVDFLFITSSYQSGLRIVGMTGLRFV